MKVRLITKSRQISENNHNFSSHESSIKESVVRIDEQPPNLTGLLDQIMQKINMSDQIMKKFNDTQEIQNKWLSVWTEHIVNQKNKSKNKVKVSNKDDKKDSMFVISNKNEIKVAESKTLSYRNLLDPRDKILFLPFHFKTQVHTSSQNQSFFEINYELVNFIKKYLVEMVESVLSVSFSFLIQEKLQQNEAKDYASKNILMNVQAICKRVTEIIQKIEKQQTQIKAAKFSLTKIVDDTLKEALNNIAPYYPQSPPTQISRRMKQNILSIDRSGNEQLDFLYTQKLPLIVQENGDYIPFIMKVVNKALDVTGKQQEKDLMQHTLKEKFVNFNQTLFWLAKQDRTSDLIYYLERQEQKPTLRSGMSSIKYTKQQLQQKLMKIFIEPFQSAHIYNGIFSISKQENAVKQDEEKQKKIEKMRKQRQFFIGQKLSNNVKIYTNKEIEDKIFYSKHSSVLRLLTKWAMNLQQIFQQPEKYTMNRKYPFKTNNNTLYTDYQPLKLKFFTKIKQKQSQLKKIQSDIFRQNTFFQSQFLCKSGEQSYVQAINRYTEVRVTASKINVLLVHLMSNYVSKLIHLLVTVTKEVSNQTNEEFRHLIEEINLVIFRVSDLMRAKVHCDEASFIRLLKLIYKLDEISQQKTGKTQDFFKLVKIKNKLDSKDNNILLTYLFMGEVECQLQIYVQKYKTKQQTYLSFNHFIYQLTRGKFGPLSELGVIVAQHDPIASLPKDGNYYHLKEQIRFKERSKFDGDNQWNTQTFVCQNCNHFKVSQNYQLFQKNKNSTFDHRICNDCIITEVESWNKQIQEYFVQQKDKWLKQAKTEGLLERLHLNKQFIPQSSDMSQLILTVNKKTGKKKILIFLFHQKEFKWYQSFIKPEFLRAQKLDQYKIKLNGIYDAQNNIEDQLFYKIFWKSTNVLQNIFREDRYAQIKLSQSKINQYVRVMQEKINKDFVQRSILDRIQSLDISDRENSFTFVQNIIKNNPYFSLSHVKYLYASKINLKVIPDWLHRLNNIQILNLQSNFIKKIDLNMFQNLKELNLKDNPLISFSLVNSNMLEKLQLRTSERRPTLQKLNINFNKLLKLTILELGGTLIHSFEIDNFSNLKQLYLRNNCFEFLSIQNMPNLQIIFIQQNHKLSSLTLDNIPSLKWIKMLENRMIETLKLINIPYIYGIDIRESNNLTQTQDQVMQLLQLLMVRLKSSLQQMNFLVKIKQLKQLWISNTSIKNISLQGYSTLSKLVIENNKELKNVNLLNLSLLEELSICNNYQLQKFYIEQMPSLMKVNLVDNPISQCFLSSTTNITELHLKGTMLQKCDLSDLNHLKILDISNNSCLEQLHIGCSEMKLLHLSLSQKLDVSKIILLKNQTCEKQELIFEGDQSKKKFQFILQDKYPEKKINYVFIDSLN